MATKTTKPEPEDKDRGVESTALLTIDELRDKHKIARPVFAGVCAANGWRAGRSMTEKEFLKAVADFTGAPMGGPQGK